MHKVVVFEFDGVIVNSAGFHDEAYMRLFSQLGIDISPARLHANAGLPARNVIDSVVEGRTRRDRKSDLDRLCTRFYYELCNVYAEKSQPSPHLDDFMHYCEAREWQVGIASCTPSNIIRMVLKKFGILKNFRVVVGGEQVKAGKPDPEMLKKVLGKMGVEPKSSIAIDSSLNGIIAAKLIGMYAIAYMRYSNDRIHQADLTVHDFNDIMGL